MVGNSIFTSKQPIYTQNLVGWIRKRQLYPSEFFNKIMEVATMELVSWSPETMHMLPQKIL